MEGYTTLLGSKDLYADLVAHILVQTLNFAIAAKVPGATLCVCVCMFVCIYVLVDRDLLILKFILEFKGSRIT